MSGHDVGIVPRRLVNVTAMSCADSCDLLLAAVRHAERLEEKPARVAGEVRHQDRTDRKARNGNEEYTGEACQAASHDSRVLAVHVCHKPPFTEDRTRDHGSATCATRGSYDPAGQRTSADSASPRWSARATCGRGGPRCSALDARQEEETRHPAASPLSAPIVPRRGRRVQAIKTDERTGLPEVVS